jgi:hypothetical protein
MGKRSRKNHQPNPPKPPKTLIVTDVDVAYQGRVPNYLLKQQAMIADGRLKLTPGTLQHVQVSHDDGCAIFLGQACNCDPDIALTDTPRDEL